MKDEAGGKSRSVALCGHVVPWLVLPYGRGEAPASCPRSYLRLFVRCFVLWLYHGASAAAARNANVSFMWNSRHAMEHF